MKLRVEVPASTSNLGPGFDTLGMALSICNTVHVQTGGEGLRVQVRGEGAGVLPEDETNVVIQAMDAAIEECGQQRPPMQVIIDNQVPITGGLGGSATALVAGVMLGNELLGGRLGRREALLDFVAELEGHPDNVAPALLGGFVTASMDGRIVQAIRFDPPEHLSAVVCAPELRSDTAQARAALPEQVPFADAVFNVGRTAVLVAAMAKGDIGLLSRAMQDRIHQHVRAAMVPGFEAVRRAAQQAGALACGLSGAGASVIAFCDDRRGREDAVGEAMVSAFGEHGVQARSLLTRPRAQGARLR